MGRDEQTEPRAFEFDKPKGYCYDEADDCAHNLNHRCLYCENTIFIDYNGQRDICPYYTATKREAPPLEKCREMYEMHTQLNMTISEIAALYGMSYQKVSYRIKKWKALNGEYIDLRMKG